MNKQNHNSSKISRYFFIEFIYLNPILLQSCTFYRKRITDVILGKNTWDRLEQERIILTRGSYHTINEIIIITDEYSKQKLQQLQLQQTNPTLITPIGINHSHVTHKLNNSAAYQNSLHISSNSRRHKYTSYSTTNITIGNKVIKPIIQKGEYDESLQIYVKPLPPTRAPRRIQKLKYYSYVS